MQFVLTLFVLWFVLPLAALAVTIVHLRHVQGMKT